MLRLSVPFPALVHESSYIQLKTISVYILMLLWDRFFTGAFKIFHWQLNRRIFNLRHHDTAIGKQA